MQVSIIIVIIIINIMIMMFSVTSCAPLRDSAVREFTHGQRKQDPTSQESFGV